MHSQSLLSKMGYHLKKSCFLTTNLLFLFLIISFTFFLKNIFCNRWPDYWILITKNPLYSICTLLSRVLIGSFDVYDLYWNFWPFFNIGPKMSPWSQMKKQYFTPFIWSVSCDITIMKTLNCDISIWEHDNEMVDHSLNHKF